MTLRCILYICTLLCAALPLRASVGAEPRISQIFHYRKADGLSSERVFSIVESPDGAIWLGTRTGVDRFNGRRIGRYLRGSNEADNAGRIVQMLVTPHGHVMAFDNTGNIYRFNAAANKFQSMLQLNTLIAGTDIVLNAVLPMDKGLLLGLKSGLYRSKNGRVTPVATGINVNHMDTLGRTVYIAAANGAAVMRPGQLPRYLLSGKGMQTVYVHRPAGRVYFGGIDNGLWLYTPATGRMERLCAGIPQLDKPIRAIERLDAHHLAIGIDGAGIYSLDTRTHTAKLLIDTDDSRAHALNGNGVYALHMDSNGTLWSGSYTGGATAMWFRPSAVSAIQHEQGNPNTLGDNNVNGVAQNTDGNIWYATDGGISIHYPDGHWRHSPMDAVTLCLAPMGGGRMLAGTYGNGLYVMDSGGATVQHLTKQDGALTSNLVFSLLRSSDGNYWAATLDGGVMRFDASLRPVRSYPVSVAFSLAQSPDGRIGVATANGFYTIDPRTHATVHYAGSHEEKPAGASSYATCLLFEGNDTVWLGTEGGGLLLYSMRSHKVVDNIRTNRGLPSNEIYSIRRDKDGNLVVSTSNGLAMKQGRDFRSLNYYHGLAAEYNKSASALLSNGDMVFGSVNGAHRITPSRIASARFKAPIRITGIETIAHTDSNTNLAHRIPVEDGKVCVPYTDNTFTVYFEAVNLPYQEDIAYSYILEGYDRDWSPVATADEAQYKNVPPGSYTMRVRSVRISTGNVLSETALPLTVAHPWWRSWWAWCLYVLMGAAPIVALYRGHMYRLKQRHDNDKLRFFINTAHDIRTPVSLVMAPVTDLSHDTSLSAQSRQLVDIASANIAKLNTITSQLLEFERLDTGRTQLHLTSVDVARLLRMEAECFGHAMSAKKIHLHVSAPQDVCVHADSYLLEMALDNLLSNACKYTNPGGSVHIKVEAERRHVHITVSDTGIGIPKQDLSKMLKEVWRAANARRSGSPGTGFGLLQVQRIVTLLGGQVQLHSTEGVGTSITLTLRRSYVAPSETDNAKQTTLFVDEIKDPAVMAPISEAQAHSHTLLIVEDNDTLRQYLAQMFGAEYNVVTAPNGRAALEYLQNGYADLILSDVMMPEMDGYQLCNSVKANPATAGIPVLLLTAKADHQSVLDGLQTGADDYLPKPFDSDVLRLKVRGFIANRNRMRQYLLHVASSENMPSQPQPELPSPETVAEVSSECPEAVPAAPNEADLKFVQQATQLVNANMANPEFDIDRLCRLMGMSRTLFYGRLKSLTGQAPQDFIRLLRLQSAAQLLRSGTPVGEVAVLTGFNNVKYFSTVFKKHYGVQPSRYGQEV